MPLADVAAIFPRFVPAPLGVRAFDDDTLEPADPDARPATFFEVERDVDRLVAEAVFFLATGSPSKSDGLSSGPRQGPICGPDAGADSVFPTEGPVSGRRQGSRSPQSSREKWENDSVRPPGLSNE